MSRKIVHAPIIRQCILADEIAHLGNINFMHGTIKDYFPGKMNWTGDKKSLYIKLCQEGKKERHEDKDEMWSSGGRWRHRERQ